MSGDLMGFKYGLDVLSSQYLRNDIDGSFYVRERYLSSGRGGIKEVGFGLRGYLECFPNLRGRVAIGFESLD